MHSVFKIIIKKNEVVLCELNETKFVFLFYSERFCLHVKEKNLDLSFHLNRPVNVWTPTSITVYFRVSEFNDSW